MKILLVHNKYLNYGGEESVVDAQIELLRNNGHEVVTYFRDSHEINDSLWSKTNAFISGFYNQKSVNEIRGIIKSARPDIVHIHNLFPFISPVVLPLIRSLNVPIVMTVHNYRLICPNGRFYVNDSICEKCAGRVKELNCIINNCEKNIFKSSGYALRNAWARIRKDYIKNVSIFLTLSSIQNIKLIQNGFEKEKCIILPNMFSGDFRNEPEYNEGNYIGYVGRISPEKGSDIILKLAKNLPNIQFKIAGERKFKESMDVPDNIQYMGFLKGLDLDEFYKNSLFTLFTSVWNETFGLTIIEAFSHKKPVVASDLGASPEIVVNGNTGLLYKNRDLTDLTLKVRSLFSDRDRIQEMGEQAYVKLKSDYSKENYYSNLISIYKKVIRDNYNSTH